MTWRTNWLIGTKIHSGWLFSFGFGYMMLWEVIGIIFEDLNQFVYLGLMMLGYFVFVYWLKGRYDIVRINKK